MKGLRFALISALVILFFAGLDDLGPAGCQTAGIPRNYDRDACTDIIVGKNASADEYIGICFWAGLLRRGIFF